jgi:hypothetical protein
MSKQTSIRAQNSISHAFKKVWNYCKRNQEIKTCTRHICCSTCVTGSTTLPLSNNIRDIQLFNGNMSFSRNQYWTTTWQLCVTSKSNSKFINIPKTFRFVWKNHFLFHRPLWQKKVDGGGKSTQILEATKLSCADYNQCGDALSKYLSSYVYASSHHFWGFVVTRGTEIGLNVVGKGPRVNQHPPIQPQSVNFYLVFRTYELFLGAVFFSTLTFILLFQKCYFYFG